MPKTIFYLLSLPAAQTLPRLDAELLLAHTIHKTREYIITHPETLVLFWHTVQFRILLYKRKQGYSIAYLTKHKAFYGLNFLVNKHTLIPRPETETLVGLVIERIKQQKITDEGCILIDVGTGSGCIPISIAKYLIRSKAIRAIYAIDISCGALRIAKKNAKKHAINIVFFHGHLLKPLYKKNPTLPTNHIIITANLPYLTQAQFDEEPSIQKEPHSALVANDNGLALYKQLLQQLTEFATHTHKMETSRELQISMYLEIDPSQEKPFNAYIKTVFPTMTAVFYKDLSGQTRVVYVSRKQHTH